MSSIGPTIKSSPGPRGRRIAATADTDAHWLEYLDKAGPILTASTQVIAGTITPTGPGPAMVWDEKSVTRYAA